MRWLHASLWSSAPNPSGIDELDGGDDSNGDAGCFRASHTCALLETGGGLDIGVGVRGWAPRGYVWFP